MQHPIIGPFILSSNGPNETLLICGSMGPTLVYKGLAISKGRVDKSYKRILILFRCVLKIRMNRAQKSQNLSPNIDQNPLFLKVVGPTSRINLNQPLPHSSCIFSFAYLQLQQPPPLLSTLLHLLLYSLLNSSLFHPILCNSRKSLYIGNTQSVIP